MSINIGFIGIGKMGTPMVMNMLKSHIVYLYDINLSALQPLGDKGGIICSTLANLCKKVSYIVMMLPSGSQVEEVCTKYDGIFNNAGKGTIIMNCSTMDIETSVRLYNLALEKEIKMLDAPVSGGVAGAEASTLTFMVGGDKDAYMKATPILATMGKKIIYAGESGSGQAAKICNNMLLGITMIGVSETFILSQKLGIDPKIFFNISKESSSKCWALTEYAPIPNLVPTSPANNEFRPGFASALMLKDLRLSQEAAASVGIETTLGNLATLLFERFVSQGNQETDFSGIINMLRGMGTLKS